MQRSLPPLSNGNRLTSVALVVGLHALIVAGLSAGLMRGPAKAPPPPTQVEVLQDTQPPPEPLPLPPRDASLRPDLPPMPVVAVPEVWSDQAPTLSLQPAEPIPPTDMAPRASTATRLPAEPASASVQPAGLLCPTQTKPQLPALAQSGTAQIRVLATVRGGRVVEVQPTVLRALPDRRAQRALLGEVEQALRSGYACTQDGVFEQEFLFRVED